MKKNIKFTVSGFILGALVMSTIPTVAKNAQETINVTYKDIKVCVDGVNIDTSGAEPFIYNGTTYLPVRAVSQAVNKPINWDGNTNTVYLGNYSGTQGNSSFNLEPYESHSYKGYSNGQSFEVAGVKRSNGFTLSDTGYAIFNLNGEYVGFTFDLGHVDGTSMINGIIKIYLDGVIAKEIEMNAQDMPKNFTIPLNGALQMKITLENPSNWYWPSYGFFDVKLY